MRRRDFLRAIAAGAALGVSGWGGASGLFGRERRRPNFVFFLLDDMGWKDLGCFGSPFYETPNIDKLAAQGMRFTNAYAACPVCSPTRASIMTGKYPARLHLTDWIPGRAQWPAAKLLVPSFQQQLPLQEITIAEAQALQAGVARGDLRAHVRFNRDVPFVAVFLQRADLARPCARARSRRSRDPAWRRRPPQR